MIRSPRKASIWAFMALVLVLAVLALPGCTKAPLGNTGPIYPYPGELLDNDGNPVQPPTWTNRPPTNSGSYEEAMP